MNGSVAGEPETPVRMEGALSTLQLKIGQIADWRGRTAHVKAALMRRTLVPHPQSPPKASIAVEAWVEEALGRFTFRYSVSGAVGALLIPAPTKPERADGLWRHTCFEAFLAERGGAYYEFNLSPSGRWAAYRFSGYRRDMRDVSEMKEIGISVRSKEDEYELLAEIDPHLLTLPASPRLGLAAVIEEKNGVISHWALAHPVEKPDFHHAAGFILELPEGAR